MPRHQERKHHSPHREFSSLHTTFVSEQLSVIDLNMSAIPSSGSHESHDSSDERLSSTDTDVESRVDSVFDTREVDNKRKKTFNASLKDIDKAVEAIEPKTLFIRPLQSSLQEDMQHCQKMRLNNALQVEPPKHYAQLEADKQTATRLGRRSHKEARMPGASMTSGPLLPVPRPGFGSARDIECNVASNFIRLQYDRTMTSKTKLVEYSAKISPGPNVNDAKGKKLLPIHRKDIILKALELRAKQVRCTTAAFATDFDHIVLSTVPLFDENEASDILVPAQPSIFPEIHLRGFKVHLLEKGRSTLGSISGLDSDPGQERIFSGSKSQALLKMLLARYAVGPHMVTAEGGGYYHASDFETLTECSTESYGLYVIRHFNITPIHSYSVLYDWLLRVDVRSAPVLGKCLVSDLMKTFQMPTIAKDAASLF